MTGRGRRFVTKVIVMMGVSGCGKTSVGIRLAEVLGWTFIDGDNYHPDENIVKMSQGIPLDDTDRASWLLDLQYLIADHLEENKPLILASSALKQKYRDQLRQANPAVKFVHLKGSYELIFKRIQKREDHFMTERMLQNQFDTLEEPAEVVVVDIEQSLEAIVEQIIQSLNL